ADRPGVGRGLRRRHQDAGRARQTAAREAGTGSDRSAVPDHGARAGLQVRILTGDRSRAQRHASRVTDLAECGVRSPMAGNLCTMRLGVLDVGSNTVHLLVVDAHRGGHPTPMTSEKTVLRLAERIDAQCGRLAEGDADELIRTISRVRESAELAGCEELLGLATSAIREADNSEEVLDRLRAETGVRLDVL